MSTFHGPPMPGDTIGHYTLLESIGLGGNATVFRAQSDEFGIVAVKILHPGKLTEVDIKRFQREFEAMHRLDHPNIIKVYEIGQHESYPWLSMELITGGDLNTFINNWNTPDIIIPNKYQQIHNVIYQLATALQCVHSNKFIHRDLKPSNILMTDTATPKLTDFGGVKNTSHTVVTELTKLGSLVGTVAFMAPEQILGEDIDHRSDLYTLGALLYMSLTGQKPFEASTMAEYLAKHLYEEPVHPCLINPEIPQYLGDLCDQLLQKEPSKRLESALAVQKFLKNAKSLHVPTGHETPVQHFIDWQESKPYGIALLPNIKGLGTQQFLKYLYSYWQSKQYQVVQKYSSLPDGTNPIVLLLTNHTLISELDDILQSIKDRTRSVYIIAISNRVFQRCVNRLTWPTHTVKLEPLPMQKIQQMVQTYGILGAQNESLSVYLNNTYQGFLDYIVDFLENNSQWLHNLTQSTNATDYCSTAPISKKAYSDLEAAWHSITPHIQPLLAGLIVYQHPLSITILPKLWNTSPTKTQALVEHLEHIKFIVRMEDEIDSLVRFSPFVLYRVLYQVLPDDLKSAWHVRIARFIAQKRRLRTDDRQQIIHHLTSIGKHHQASPHYEKLIQSAGKQIQWTQVQHWAQQMELFDLEPKDKTTWTFVEQAYAHLGDYSTALQYNQKIQALSDSSIQTIANAYLYKHNLSSTLCDDNTIDPIIQNLSTDSVINQQIIHLRSLQHLLFNRPLLSSQLWQKNTAVLNSIWAHRANVGLAVIHDLEHGTDSFLHLLAEHPEQQFGLWHQWYCERLITSGRWNQLEQYLVKRIAFGLSELEDDIFASWYDYLTGNATRAQERLVQAQSKIKLLDSPDLNTMLHYVRLSRRMHISLIEHTPNWSLYGDRIENYLVQWNIVQQTDFPSTIKTPIFWQKDFALLDLAMHESSEVIREHIWEQVSPESLGIKVQIAKIFSDSSKNPIWADKHRHTLDKCARNRTGDFHAWH